MNKAFLPKDDQELPDNYGMKIFYVNSKAEEFELASHRFDKENGILEFWTKEDICNWLSMANVQRLEFDKRFSKMIAVKAKINKKTGG